MGRSGMEDIKERSGYLRGTIAEELAESSPKFSKESSQLLKSHGTYQQDHRDLRNELKKEGKDRHFMFMVRTAIPGGEVTPEQYLAHDRLASEVGNDTMRITSRQGLQTHGVLKGTLKSCIQRINETGVSTKGACGDNVRNVMATPIPLADPVHQDVQRLAKELRKTFTAHTNAYTEIWLDGEKIESEPQSDNVEPIYGRYYLPRKFKIGIAVPPRNDVDVYTHDLGMVPYFPTGEVEGYTFYVGGGMGMTHGKDETYPTLSQPLFYVPRNKVIETAIAAVTVQRDHGNRENRRRARLRYLLEERGLDWYRKEVEARLDFKPDAPKPVEWDTVSDRLGWHEQGDGKLFCCVWVEDGRIKDTETIRYRSGFRNIVERFGFPIRFTPNCSLLFYDIDPSQKGEIDALLAEHGIPHTDGFSEARKLCMACVALPTCGLALAESERALPGLMDQIDEILRGLELQKEPILIRMTGCPNGCARPYNADISFVGRGPERYALYAGGSVRGDRLASLHKHTVTTEQIPTTVQEILAEFKTRRSPGELFTDYWTRSHPNGTAPHPEQFHYELEARNAVRTGNPPE